MVQKLRKFSQKHSEQRNSGMITPLDVSDIVPTAIKKPVCYLKRYSLNNILEQIDFPAGSSLYPIPIPI